jgi:hypothetical protein
MVHSSNCHIVTVMLLAGWRTDAALSSLVGCVWQQRVTQPAHPLTFYTIVFASFAGRCTDAAGSALAGCVREQFHNQRHTSYALSHC